MDIIYIIIGVAIGLVIGFLIAKLRTPDVSMLNAKIENQKKDFEQIIANEKVSFSQRIAQEQETTSKLVAAEKASAAILIAQTKEHGEALLKAQKNASENMIAAKDRAFIEAIEEKDRIYKESLAEKERVFNKALEDQKIHNDKALKSLQERFDETIAKMKAELEAVTAKMLRERQAEFETSSKEKVSEILRPLNENIQKMQESVAANTIKHAELGGELSSDIKKVMEHSEAARQSADRLANALRGSNKVQGYWGEKVLAELLNSQGLEEGIHFDTQVFIRDAAGNTVKGCDGSALQPDIILHLDDRRDVIIDSKVSLSAYLDYVNASTDEDRERALRNHIQSIERHVKELAAKDYTSYVQSPKIKMDYVIMFVPNTSALYAATSNKPDLWRKAMEHDVYIADEQTLYAALRIINMTWRQIAQAQNHEKVFGLANEMLDRVSQFLQHFTKVGETLDKAQDAYNKAYKKLDESGQSIPQTSRKLISLGATVNDRKGVDRRFFYTDSDITDTSLIED